LSPLVSGGRHSRDTARDEQRLDKWLWFARFAKSRSLAAKLIEGGCIRVNRQRTIKPSTAVKCGDVLTMTLYGRVRVIEIRAAGERRGPASEAQTLYSEIVLPSAKTMDEDLEE
jgi:ribosome-associated heat shock protein Hsp15